MFYIFRTKIYDDQIFYNDLCHRYFGVVYITNFTVNDIKASCCVLLCRAIHKREKMIMFQMMNIFNNLQALYHCFTYFYFTEFGKDDDIFNNWFYSKLPQFSVNYNMNINSDGNNEYISFILF